MEKRSKKKGIILVLIILAILLVSIFIVAIIYLNSSGQRVKRQITLGDKYLSEMEYEEAVLAYSMAIDIDSKAIDAYIGLAKSYYSMGDEEKALSVVEEGIRAVGETAALIELKNSIEITRTSSSEVTTDLKQARSSLISMNDALENYIWVVLMTNAPDAANESMNIVLSDEEKVRAAALASDADGFIDEIFVYNDGELVVSNNAETGPYGNGYHGRSVSDRDVGQNCKDLFGTRPNWDEMQTRSQCDSFDAVKYTDDKGTHIILLSDETETETDQERHDIRITKNGSGYIGEVDLFHGYWGDLDNNPGLSNYSIKYILEPDTESKYGMIVSSIFITRVEGSNDLSDDIQSALSDDDDDHLSDNVEEDIPFYGVWCLASKEQKEAQNEADRLLSLGFDGKVFVSSEWKNLNQDKWYVVTAGIYYEESEAVDALEKLHNIGYPSAYVKFTGDYKDE